jgi:hypothetical protein
MGAADADGETVAITGVVPEEGAEATVGAYGARADAERPAIQAAAISSVVRG